MSSLFSDPPFSRGTTLLGGEVVEYSPPNATYSQTNASGAQYPVAGSEIVGQVKVFLDANPSTKYKMSNELVYCIAARYKPSSATNLTAARGKAVTLTVSQYGGTAEFAAFATATDVNTGERVGFIDEYISDETVIRPDDIVWVVFRGPAAVKKTEHASTAGIAAGVNVAVSGTAGSVFTKTVDSVYTNTSLEPSLLSLGICWGDISDDLSEVAFGVTAPSTDKFARVNLVGRNWS
jgi:hypothetical protein